MGAVRQIQFMFLATAFTFTTTGCSSLHQNPQSSSAPATAASDVRNNAASLLYDLLGDERNVGKLLIIKRDREELHRVIKDISKTAAAAHGRLERFAKEDSQFNLKDTALPPGETATRDAESKARAKEILRASGADFEFKLLLSQAEALAYAEHLASVAAQNESNSKHADAFREISAEMQRLHGQVLELLHPRGNAK
jgi:hypothetical protein